MLSPCYSFRDYRHITFVMLKQKPLPHVLNGEYRIPTKIKWKIHNLFTLYFKFWRYFLTYFSHYIFDFLMFFLAFTSADIIFHNILELHSTLTDKKIFVTNFPFLTDSLNPAPAPPTPNPLNGQNPLNVTKVFCRCSLRCWDLGRGGGGEVICITFARLAFQLSSKRKY